MRCRPLSAHAEHVADVVANEPQDGFRSCRYSAQDGLRLYYRDYGTDNGKAPVLCLPGLTRNSADFHVLATRLAPQRRVICPDLRGRGRSAYDPNSENYTAHTYVLDLIHLLTVTGCHHVVVLGTSLGGLLAMGLGAFNPTAIAGVILNDIGPELNPVGVTRIRGYAGKDPGAMTLDEAVTRLRTLFSAAMPDLTEAQWIDEVKRSYREDDDGRYVLDYDPAISQAAGKEADQGLDLWPFFRALRHIPALSIRGALSDILSAETVTDMVAAKPDLQCATVANRGHTPMLDEPECLAAIDQFLDRHGDHDH